MWVELNGWVVGDGMMSSNQEGAELVHTKIVSSEWDAGRPNWLGACVKIRVGREESYAEVEFIDQTLTIFIQARLGPNSTHAEA